jgi:hypothetical protein
VVEKVSFEFRGRTCEKIPLDVETLWSTLHPQRDNFAQQVKTLPTKLFGLNAKPKQKIFGGVSDSILSQSFSFFWGRDIIYASISGEICLSTGLRIKLGIRKFSKVL